MKLRNDVCRSVLPVDIFNDAVVINGRKLTRSDHLALVMADGFESIDKFHDFFRKQYELPLVGKMELINW